MPHVPPRGYPVCTSCAPLGAPALLGAVCRGVVSGSAPGGLLTLTDARVSPGSEGAGVFALGSGSYATPFAVVFSPLTWWRGEAVGFTLCLGLRKLLAAAVRDLKARSAPSRGPARPALKLRPPAPALQPALQPLSTSALQDSLDLYGE